MGISKQEWLSERKWLDKTLKIIQNHIKKYKGKVEDYKDNIVKVQKNMWEDKKINLDPTRDLEGAAIAWQHQTDILNEAESMKFYIREKNKLERMHQSPYFGRIDFIEEGEEKEVIYIGIAGLTGDDFIDYIVYDWRSPICSLFYDYEIGDAEYHCPLGNIKGNLTLKRQYKIEDQKIVYMFNSGLKINDEILQNILGKSTDDKMKTIVTSIQQEQNRLIRDESNHMLVIQGTAGSGKTSIALHRIAFILYRNREKLNASNIVLFSPNQIFSDYISDVLPELGEENVNRTTFNDYIEALIGREMIMEDWNNQMEYILSKGINYDDVRQQCIAFKTSDTFVKVLKKYVSYIRTEGLKFKDIYYKDNLIASAKEIEVLYLKNQSFFSPLQSINKIKLRLLHLIESYVEEELNKRRNYYLNSDEVLLEEELEKKIEVDIEEAFRDIRQSIEEVTRFDLNSIYLDLYRYKDIAKKINNDKILFSEEVIAFTLQQFNDNILLYEDALALVYLKGELEGAPNTHNIKHVVIDEAQDYSFLHYEIINQVFPKAGLTLLGDLNQSINPFLNIGKYEKIKSIFNREKISQVNLIRSYRSTKQIANFCSNILNGKDKTIFLEREGKEPQVISLKSSEQVYDNITKSIQNYSKEGFQSIAIICKTARESKKTYSALRDRADIKILTSEAEEFEQGIVVVPSYLAKGLEFDVVLVCCHEDNNYLREEERNLFYTVCSRSLHVLDIYYVQRKPVFIDFSICHHVRSISRS